MQNARALQGALDRGGLVEVHCPGIYDISGTLLIGSNTHLRFAAGVVLRKTADDDGRPWRHLLLNRGALHRTTDENVSVTGLTLMVNGMDGVAYDNRAHGSMPRSNGAHVFGMRGQLALFHVRNAAIRRFRCLDVGPQQFAIHVCTFDHLLIEDVQIRGWKDGVHLGRGRDFVIRHAVFQTEDDAIALNAYDYATSNPELGWLSDGVVQDVTDMSDGHPPNGFFSRLLAGAWVDWTSGMEVRHGDAVVSDGAVYRVVYHEAIAGGGSDFSGTSTSAPSDSVREFERRAVGRDGVPWLKAQADVQYSAGVRNVSFGDIRLLKRRYGVTLRYENNSHVRSVHPLAPPPVQGPISLERVTMDVSHSRVVVHVSTPHVGVSIDGVPCRASHACTTTGMPRTRRKPSSGGAHAGALAPAVMAVEAVPPT